MSFSITGGPTAAIDLNLEVFPAFRAAPTETSILISSVAAWSQLLAISAVSPWLGSFRVPAALCGPLTSIKVTRLDSNTGDIEVNMWMRRYWEVSG